MGSVELHTNLIQLNRKELGATLAQQLLRGAAVRAVRLAEDGDGVLVDDGLHFGLGGRHGGGRGGAREEAAEEGYFGGWGGLRAWWSGGWVRRWGGCGGKGEDGDGDGGIYTYVCKIVLGMDGCVLRSGSGGLTAMDG